MLKLENIAEKLRVKNKLFRTKPHKRALGKTTSTNLKKLKRATAKNKKN